MASLDETLCDFYGVRLDEVRKTLERIATSATVEALALQEQSQGVTTSQQPFDHRSHIYDSIQKKAMFVGCVFLAIKCLDNSDFHRVPPFVIHTLQVEAWSRQVKATDQISLFKGLTWIEQESLANRSMYRRAQSERLDAKNLYAVSMLFRGVLT